MTSLTSRNQTRHSLLYIVLCGWNTAETKMFVHKDRIRFCYEESIGDPFDSVTNKMLYNTAMANSVPLEYLIPPFVTAVSHCLNKSEINPWGSWSQPSILYSATVGFTGTNKTAAMDAVRNAIMDVEHANGIFDLQSRINQCKYLNKS